MKIVGIMLLLIAFFGVFIPAVVALVTTLQNFKKRKRGKEWKLLKNYGAGESRLFSLQKSIWYLFPRYFFGF
jgi:hypothetical protein